MIKKYVCAVLAVVILVLPTSNVFANTNTNSVQALTDQITALQKYTARIMLQQRLVQAEVLSHEEMRGAITNGTSWLVGVQEESGHFGYEYLPYENDYLVGDNIVRQAGALYALSEVARRDTYTDTNRTEAIENAIAYFETVSPVHSYKGEDVRCVTKNISSKTCMLGATALALSGVLGYVESAPNKRGAYEDLVDGYITFIVAAKKADEGFRDSYRVGTGFTSDKESSFSNGEALLALVRYYQYSPSVDVKEIIDKTFVYLQKNEFDTPLYLWAMAALKDMQKLWPNEAYTTYGEKFTNWRMDNLKRSHHTNRNYCASTEGLASAYSLIEESAPATMLENLRTEIDFWNTKNIDLQIDTGDTYRVAMHEDGSFGLKHVIDMEQSRGGFLTADDELTQRIDFTQHCVSTYIQTLVDIDNQQL